MLSYLESLQFLIFQNKNIHVMMEVMHQAQNSLIEYQKLLKPSTNIAHYATRRRSHNDGNWCPPPRNPLKLNVDVHLLGNGHWGLGLVLRLEDRSSGGAITKVVQGVDTTMGLVTTDEFLAQFKRHVVIIEMDNSTVVKALQACVTLESIGDKPLERVVITLKKTLTVG
jgi:hypothetical protein